MNKSKVLRIILILLLMTLIIWKISVPVFADAGSFSSYHSGGSSGSHSSSDDDDGEAIFWLIWLAIEHPVIGVPLLVIFIIYVIFRRKKKKEDKGIINNNAPPGQQQYVDNSSDNRDIGRSHDIANKIRVIDPNFSEENFCAYAKDIYVRLQNAIVAKNLDEVKPYLSDKLYNEYIVQIDNPDIPQRVAVFYADLYNFEVNETEECLYVKISARMNEIRKDYFLTFTRTKGMKTGADGKVTNTTNCPNCGAPTTITTSGKCEYCGQIITTGNHGWILTDIQNI